MSSGSITEAQIEQILILLRAFGVIMGVPDAALQNVLDKARTDMLAGRDERPGPPGPT